jgi:hypothetical protein
VVFIDDQQRAKMDMLWILVVRKGKAVVGFKPAAVNDAALKGWT